MIFGIIIVSAIRMNRDRHSNHLPYRQVLNLEILQEMRIMSAAVYCTWEIMTFTVVTDQDTGRRR